jgi:hypothetical protein
MADELSPWALFLEAYRRLPVLKWALGVAGIGALVAVVLSFHTSPAVAGFGILIAIGLAGLLFLFAVCTQLKMTAFANLAVAFLWAVTLLSVIAISLVLTSYFFSWPRQFSDRKPEPPATAVTQKHDPAPEVAAGTRPEAPVPASARAESPAPEVARETRPAAPVTRTSYPEPEEPRAINLTGRWRDETGTIYLITQHGATYEFQAINQLAGTAAAGSGMVQGREWQTSFTTNYGSQGTGRGVISADGNETTGTFQDTRYGVYSRTIVRIR